jgi:membrane-associated phospholipid phosphatase
VMATANHYLLDVAAGALTAGVSVTFALIWERRRRADRVVATP